jgi:HK97 family phage major capsid protein
MEAKDLKALLDEQKGAYNALQAALTKQTEETAALGRAHSDTLAKVKQLADIVADLETKMQRPAPIVPKEKAGDEQPVHLKAFEKFLRFGLKGNAALERMTDEERVAFKAIQTKALSESDDSRGGFTVPEDARTEVVKRIPYYSGIGALVNRSTTSRDMVRWPRLVGGSDTATSAVAVTYEDETDTVSETDFTMGSVAISIQKARTLVKVSADLLEDTAVDVVGLIYDLAAEAFGQDEENRIVTGATPKVPVGFMTDTDIASANSGANGAIAYDNVVDIVHALPEQYAKDARFLFRRSTLGYLLKIKVPQFSGDTAGVPLWQPSIQAGAPGTILGYPYSIVEYMPAIATGAYPLAFGNLRRLYTAIDRVGMSVKRLDEKYADTDEVGFIFRRRWGGRPVAPWALRKLRTSA